VTENNPPNPGKNNPTPEGKRKPKYIGRVPIDAKTGKDARPRKIRPNVEKKRSFVVTRCAYCGDIITRSGNRHWDVCSKCEDVGKDVN